MIYEKCREILLKESELVQNAFNIQKKIQEAVFNREWTDFEGHFIAMNALEGEIAALEIEREGLFLEFEASNERDTSNGKEASLDDPKGRFYSMTAHLPAEQRNDLTSIYRSLKLEAMKLRMANDVLMNYLGGVKAGLTDFFELAFPDRGGKMYTHEGTHLSHDMRSMVLNRRF